MALLLLGPIAPISEIKVAWSPDGPRGDCEHAAHKVREV